MMDVNQYIGVPYKSLGRSPDGWDCYGLVRHLFAEHLGVTLPDWKADPDDLKAVIRTFRDARKDTIANHMAKQIMEPEDWAIVLVDKGKAAHHIGVFLAGGVLHCDLKVQTQWNEWSTFRRLYVGNEIRLYRWQPS